MDGGFLYLFIPLSLFFSLSVVKATSAEDLDRLRRQLEEDLRRAMASHFTEKRKDDTLATVDALVALLGVLRRGKSC